MAEKKNTVDKEALRKAHSEEKIPFVVRRPEGVQEDFTTVTVNGKNYQIAYGKTVMIPRFVAKVIENAYAASDDADIKRQKFVSLFDTKARELS
jgi:hypothetical protein